MLQSAYTFDKAKLVVREMTDLLDKRLVTDQLVLTVGYDIDNLMNQDIKKSDHGEITTDHYGRSVPKSAHGSINLERQIGGANIPKSQSLTFSRMQRRMAVLMLLLSVQLRR